MNAFLNLLFPPQCLNCSARVPEHGTLCLACWRNIQFITDPCCACCGHPFDFATEKEALCGDCLLKRPSFAKARAAFRYDEHSRGLVLKLKYADQAQLAKIYGRWLSGAGRELVEESDVIVPVPLHYWRFLGRRYNQSALLAYALGKSSGKTVLPDALKRTRSTPPQAGLTRKQRMDNVKGAFTFHPRRKEFLKSKNILLIDDVMTTGSTLDECGKALLGAGAMRVNVLTLAMTV